MSERQVREMPYIYNTTNEASHFKCIEYIIYYMLGINYDKSLIYVL